MIYSKYIDDPFSEQYDVFVKYLNENNKWEKGKLTHLNKTYNILIKLHGKSPTQHIENDHYSLGIKMLNNEKINGVSRFNLIVYWRIRKNYDIIKYLSQKMGIYHSENILTKVRINNKPEKLYYFEFRINREYLKKINKRELIVLKNKSDHSLIYTGGDIELWNKKLKKTIKKIDFNDSLKILISDKYLCLNKAIYEEDLEKTLSYFDIKYLAKVQAFRYLFGDNGHGFGHENLLMAFNTSDLKFYPILHRDISTLFKTQEINGQFNGYDLIGNAGALFNTLSKSKILAEKTKNYLTNFLSSRTINEHSMDSIIKHHNTYYYSSNFKQSINWGSTSPSTIHMLNLISRLKMSSTQN